MTDITASAYDDLRSELKNNQLLHAELIDDGGTAHTLIDLVNDTRANWTSDASNNPATLEIQISGGDNDITTPVTFTQLNLYPTTNATDRKAYDTYQNATLEASGDELTITSNLEVPKI